MRSGSWMALMLVSGVLPLAACSRKPAVPADTATPPAAQATAPAASATPTGTVITITLITDEKGSRFEPANVTARRGDVLRFTLGAGVHNVHFLPDSNPGVPALPAASDMLQLPQQTFDVPVNFQAGTYYFQCDPHSALGMMGHLKVE